LGMEEFGNSVLTWARGSSTAPAPFFSMLGFLGRHGAQVAAGACLF
jgi:hypothetical protein